MFTKHVDDEDDDLDDDLDDEGRAIRDEALAVSATFHRATMKAQELEARLPRRGDSGITTSRWS